MLIRTEEPLFFFLFVYLFIFKGMNLAGLTETMFITANARYLFIQP